MYIDIELVKQYEKIANKDKLSPDELKIVDKALQLAELIAHDLAVDIPPTTKNVNKLLPLKKEECRGHDLSWIWNTKDDHKYPYRQLARMAFQDLDKQRQDILEKHTRGEKVYCSKPHTVTDYTPFIDLLRQRYGLIDTPNFAVEVAAKWFILSL